VIRTPIAAPKTKAHASAGSAAPAASRSAPRPTRLTFADATDSAECYTNTNSPAARVSACHPEA
jgi:hypothetical protein